MASVCILPYFVAEATRLLGSSPVLCTTTIGFPHGATDTRVKLTEAEIALDAGARELDCVVNLSRVLSGEFDPVAREIARLVELTHDAKARLKIIFENCFLLDEHKIELCRICGSLGVDWVKTSTGFGQGGATPDDVALMRRHSPRSVQVKASGGIGDLDTLIAYLKFGVTRVGTSRTAKILAQAKDRFS